jgi:hypothetical protein
MSGHHVGKCFLYKDLHIDLKLRGLAACLWDDDVEKPSPRKGGCVIALCPPPHPKGCPCDSPLACTRR